MILYVQFISIFINYDLYDSRELAIYLCWIPLLSFFYYVSKKKWVYRIIVSLFFIDGLLNLSHFLILKGPLSASSLFVLANTNLNEAKEFMELKFSFLFLLLIPYLIFYFFALRKVPKVTVYPNSKWIVLLTLLYSFIFIAENTIADRFIRKGIPQTAKALVSFAEEFKSYSALKKRTVLPIDAHLNSTTKKERIFVLIIGESCNRNHMSLYNYHRNTNPKLGQRKDIIVYTNVISPYSNTLKSVLSSLTESNLENKKGFDTSISIIDVFHGANMKTFWLSNQSPIGIWDNAIYNLAQTSDRATFLNNKGNSSFESLSQASYDELLLKPFDKVVNEKTGNKLIIVHLMGSHSSYAKRYPEAFNNFSNHQSGKEQTINEYDNSVLYNDYIVDSLLSILNTYSTQNRDIIASAIYLSDHGENVYDENDNVGHDYSGSLPKSNVEIPFIVWLSPGFKQFYPEKQKTIQFNKDAPFMSDDLFHAILDLNDISCKQYNKTRSVFNAYFNSKRLRVLEDNKDYDSK